MSRGGSLPGVPLYADACTSQQLRVSFARLLIEMNIRLPEEIQFEDANGLVHTQKVQYEWKPPFCTICNKVGHSCAKKDAAKLRLGVGRSGCLKLSRLKIL